MENKFMRIRNIIYAAAATLLAACTNSDEMPTPGTVALQVNATITNANTRLGFSGTTFASGKAISLFADDGTTSGGTTTPITYTANADASAGGDANSKAAFSPASGSGYLFNTEDDVKFTAIYPAITSGGSFSVTSDCKLSNTSGGNISTATQSDDLDILFAEGEASIFDPELKLTFNHVMAKLTFNLTAGDGFDATEVQGATVELTSIITDATFNTATGTLTPATTKGEVKANVTSSSAADYAAIAEAIVIPQSEEATFNLKVTTDNDMSYTKRLTIKLEAGNNYVYPVTLTKQSLTVGSASIADWDNVEVEDAVSMRYQSPIKTITDKADVRKYDYLMKDGTFLRVPSEYLSSLSDSEKENIAGVVFWTKAENAEDCPDLSTDGQLSEDLQHGLVVSANAGISEIWNESTNSTIGGTTYNIEALNGYSNTMVLKKYNDSNPTYPVLAVSAIANEGKVTGTSGWYLPSPREGVYLFGGTTCLYEFFTKDTSEINKYLSNKLEAAIWTSIEYYSPSAYVVNILYGSGEFGAALKNKDGIYVRPICAF
jgi:hypothetical protein